MGHLQHKLIKRHPIVEEKGNLGEAQNGGDLLLGTILPRDLPLMLPQGTLQKAPLFLSWRMKDTPQHSQRPVSIQTSLTPLLFDLLLHGYNRVTLVSLATLPWGSWTF
jgi:hypothetical protein